MGDWYEIGITLGLGVAAGLLLAGMFAAWRYGLLTSVLGALAIGALAGLLVKGWIGLPGALIGGVIGAVSASLIARGALRLGGTPGGTAFLVGSASLFVAMLALWVLVLSREHGDWRLLALAGALFGVAALIRGAGLLLPVAALPYLWMTSRGDGYRTPWRTSFGQAAAVLGAMRGIAEHVAAKKARLLATMGEKRDPAFADSPTLVELGYPGLVVIGWNGLLAPAATPSDILQKLSREIGRHLSVPEFRDRMASLGADPSPSTPEAFAAFIRGEAAKWQKVVRAIGLEHSQ